MFISMAKHRKATWEGRPLFLHFLAGKIIVLVELAHGIEKIFSIKNKHFHFRWFRCFVWSFFIRSLYCYKNVAPSGGLEPPTL